MRKIVGFRINLRAWELLRRAKKEGITLEVPQEALQSDLDRIVKSLKPAILFETFGVDDADQKTFSPISGIAYSLILATIGEPALPLQPVSIGSETLVWEMALEECRKFAVEIISSEAQKDSCELTPVSLLLAPEIQEAAIRKMDGSKIGVSFQEGRMAPLLSSVASLSWISKIKKKKPKSQTIREPGADKTPAES